MFTIEDLSKGRCAVINDGTLEQLHEVMKLAFPNDVGIVCANYKFYFASNSNNNIWDYSNSTNLPTQSVKDFINKVLKRGDLVWVDDNDPNNRDSKGIFVANIEGANFPIICVEECDEENFKNGKPFNITMSRYATKVEETDDTEVCMTFEEIEKALNIKNLKIVKK